MAFAAVPATNFLLSVETAPSTFTTVGGLDTLNFAPNTATADATVFENAGWTQTTTVSRGITVTASGKALYDETGDKDPGQLAVEALGEALGAAAVGTFRIELPSGDYLEFDATVTDVTPFGGGVNGLAEWSCTLVASAAPTIVVAP